MSEPKSIEATPRRDADVPRDEQAEKAVKDLTPQETAGDTVRGGQPPDPCLHLRQS